MQTQFRRLSRIHRYGSWINPRKLQETRFRTQWHCYYSRQVRRIPVSIPRSCSGYNYQYLYLYNIKPAEVISGTSCLSDSVYSCRKDIISHICIRIPSLYHSKFHISKSITKNKARRAKKKKNSYPPYPSKQSTSPPPAPQQTSPSPQSPNTHPLPARPPRLGRLRGLRGGIWWLWRRRGRF